MDSSPSMELHLGSFLCLHLLPFTTRRNNDSGSRLSQSAGLRPFPTRPVMYNEEHTVSDYADSSRVNSYTSPLYSDRPLYSDPPMFSSPLPGFGDHSVGVFPDASPMYSDPSSASLFSDASSPLFADHTSAPAWTSMHSSWTPRESLLRAAHLLRARWRDDFTAVPFAAILFSLQFPFPRFFNLVWRQPRGSQSPRISSPFFPSFSYGRFAKSPSSADRDETPSM